MKYAVEFKRTWNWWGEEWPEISAWCNETYGKDSWDWDHVSQQFKFEKESDKVLFMLRWK